MKILKSKKMLFDLVLNSIAIAFQLYVMKVIIMDMLPIENIIAIPFLIFCGTMISYSIYLIARKLKNIYTWIEEESI